MFQIDLQSRVPIYEQLKSRIIKLTMLGVLKDHANLPSVRNLARDIGVNPNTVQKAYQELEKDNIIYSIVGSGSFVSPKTTIMREIRTKAKESFEKSVVLAKENYITKDEATQIVDMIYNSEEKSEGVNI
ncbi:MAG: GntR family transcriptional regulator [Oscillospiraceae bacterium]